MQLTCARVFIGFLFILNQTQAQEKAKANSLKQKIEAVEMNLSSWAKIVGGTSWTIAERMKHHNVKAVSIAVVKNYKIDWAKSYGWADEQDSIPATLQTRFLAGSISKSLNSVGLLKLVQDKKVDLFADINNYLTSWKFPYDSLSKEKRITLANLLSHTAGLSVHGFPGYAPGDSVPGLPQILDGKRPSNTAAVRSLFEPGIKFKYSGGGTTISQLLLVDVSRQPYEKFMWQQVLRPMGMMNSTFEQPLKRDSLKPYATAYYEDGREVKGKYHIYPEKAAAGLWTTPTDLAKYIIETQLALLGKSKKVLNQQTTQLRLTSYIDKEAALGVFITENEGGKYFGHNGQDEGFTASYFGSFDGNGMVVMSNSNSGRLNGEIINSIATVYNLKGLMPVSKKVMAVPVGTAAKYIGTYLIEDDTLIISSKNNELVIGIKNTPIEWKMNFTSETNFFLMELKGEFDIEKMNGDKVQTILLKQGSAVTKVERLR